MYSTWNRYALMGALAALLVLLGATAGQAAAASGVGPARRFAPRQLVVKFEGEKHGRTVGLPRGAGVLATARALRAKPQVEYAEPNYTATASDAELEPYDPDDPGTLEAPPGTVGSSVRVPGSLGTLTRSFSSTCWWAAEAVAMKFGAA